MARKTRMHRDRFGSYDIVMERVTGSWQDCMLRAESWIEAHSAPPWKLQVAKDPTPGRRWHLKVWFKVG